MPIGVLQLCGLELTKVGIREAHVSGPRNIVEYAFAVGRGPEIVLDELPPELLEDSDPPGPAESLSPRPDDERARIEAALRLPRDRVSQAANQLGMSRATFWRKRKKYGL